MASGMGPYQLLFSIAAEHGFFSDGLWQDVCFVPTSEAKVLMANAGLLARETANRTEIYFDRSRSDVFRRFLEDADGRLCFGFKAHVGDATFKNYSEAFVSAPDALPYFESDQGVREGDRIRLHRGKQVSPEDMDPVDSASLSGLLHRQDRVVRPAFAMRICPRVRINGDLLESPAVAPARYFLRFGSRQTYWTYYLLGNLAKKSVNVVDFDGGIEFDALGITRLSDDRPALAFRSKAPIALKQRSACRFQLREVGVGNGKLLIKRLPVARADQVNRQTIGGQLVSVSEVYVNG